MRALDRASGGQSSKGGAHRELGLLARGAEERRHEDGEHLDEVVAEALAHARARGLRVREHGVVRLQLRRVEAQEDAHKVHSVVVERLLADGHADERDALEGLAAQPPVRLALHARLQDALERRHHRAVVRLEERL